MLREPKRGQSGAPITERQERTWSVRFVFAGRKAGLDFKIERLNGQLGRIGGDRLRPITTGLEIGRGLNLLPAALVPASTEAV